MNDTSDDTVRHHDGRIPYAGTAQGPTRRSGAFEWKAVVLGILAMFFATIAFRLFLLWIPALIVSVAMGVAVSYVVASRRKLLHASVTLGLYVGMRVVMMLLLYAISGEWYILPGP